MNSEEIAGALESLSFWKLEGDEILRTYVWGSFPEAIRFVAKVAELAEAQNHHPHIAIDYRKVTLRLTTHSVGALTEKDFKLASACEALV